MSLENSSEKVNNELSSMHLETSMTNSDLHRRLAEREKQSAEMLRKIDKDKNTMEEYRLEIHELKSEVDRQRKKADETVAESKKLHGIIEEKDKAIRLLEEAVAKKDQEINYLKKELLQYKEDLEINQSAHTKLIKSNSLVLQPKSSESQLVQVSKTFQAEQDLQDQYKTLQENFNAFKTTVANQKQRAELKLKAVTMASETQKREMEMTISELEEKVIDLEEKVSLLTTETTQKQNKIKKMFEENSSNKREAFEQKQKATVVSVKFQNLKAEMQILTQKSIKLQQDLQNQKQFTSTYLDALQKDVQRTVDESLRAMRTDLDFYKSEYNLFKTFLYEARDMIRSRGPLQNWVNALFPE